MPLCFPVTLKYWLGVQWGQSYHMEEGTSLILVGHPSSDDVQIKVPYGVNILLHPPASHPSFPIGLVKTESDFIIRSVETGLGRWW